MAGNVDPFAGLEELFRFFGVQDAEMLDCRMKFLNRFQTAPRTFVGRLNQVLTAHPTAKRALRNDVLLRIEQIRNFLVVIGETDPLVNAIVIYNGMFILAGSTVLLGCTLAEQNMEDFNPLQWSTNQIARVIRPFGDLDDEVVSLATSLMYCKGSIDRYYHPTVFDFAREFAGTGKLAQNPIYRKINFFTFAWAVMGQEDSALPVVARWVLAKTQRKIKDWFEFSEAIWGIKTPDGRMIALLDVVIEIINHELTYIGTGQQGQSFFIESF